MPGLAVVGRVGVDVAPVVTNFHNKLRDSVLPGADRIGLDLGETIGQAAGRTLANQIANSIPNAVTDGGRRARVTATRQGADVGGAFSRSLKTKLDIAFRSLPKIDVGISDTGVDAELARIRAKIGELADKRIGIEIDEAVADAKIKDLEQQLVRLGEQNPSIRVRTDTAVALTALRAVRSELNRVDGDTATATVEIDVEPANAPQSISLLGASIAGLGPAILPVLENVTAGVTGFAVALVGAAGAAGVFGLATAGAVADANNNAQAVDKAKTALAQQRAELDRMKPKSKAYEAQLKNVAKAQRDLTAAQKEYTPQQRAFVKAQTAMGNAYSKFVAATSAKTLPIADTVIGALTSALPKLVPLVKAVAPVAQEAASAFKNWVNTRLDYWVSWLGTSGVLFLKRLIDTGRNIASVLGSVFRDFTPLATSSAEGLARLSSRLASFGTNGGFSRFLADVRKEAPQIRAFLDALGGALKTVSQALIKMGPAALGTTTALLRLVAAMSPGEVQALAYAYIAVRAAMVGYSAYTAIATAVTWLQADSQIALNAGLQISRIGAFGMVAAQIAQAAASAIVTAATWTWNLAQRALNITFLGFPLVWILAALAALVAGFIIAYQHSATFRAIVQGAWHGIEAGAKAVFGWFSGPFVSFFVKTLPGAFHTTVSWVQTHWPLLLAILTGPVGLATLYITRHWKQIQDGISGVWHWLTGHVFGPMETFFTSKIPGWARSLKDHVVDAFKAARDGIGKAWLEIEGKTKTPINWVIDHVWNTGIVSLWKKITGWIPGVPKLGKLNKLATGGILPGYTPGKDVHLAALSGGEAVMRPEWTRAVGAGFVHSMNAIARRGGVGAVQQAMGGALPAFSLGGIAGDIGGALSGAASDLWNGTKGLASFLADPVKGFKKLVQPLLDKATGHFGSTSYEKMAIGLPKKAFTGLENTLKKAASSLFSGGGGGSIGGSGVKRWSTLVLEVLSLLHQSPKWLDTVLRRMNQESGGNPRAINSWDVNAAHGDPSRGLMQTIGSTFNAYAGQFRSRGIYDPLANIYAGLNYALHRYGTLAALSRPGGYAGGGFPGAGELAWVGEQGPELVHFNTPGHVYSSAESTRMLRDSLTSISARSQRAPNIVVQNYTYLGTQEITDVVDHRVKIHNDGVAASISTGRRP